MGKVLKYLSLWLLCALQVSAQSFNYSDSILHIKELYRVSKYNQFILDNTKNYTEPFIADYIVPIYATIYRNNTLVGNLSSQAKIVYYGVDTDWYIVGDYFESDIKIKINPTLYYSCNKIEISYYNPLKQQMINGIHFIKRRNKQYK